MVIMSSSADHTISALRRLRERLTVEALDPMIEREAQVTLARLIQATPVRWSISGARQSWKLIHDGVAQYRVTNDNVVMGYLERGTGQRTGGYIYPVQAKALFIPLTKKAALANRTGFQKATIQRLVARQVGTRAPVYRGLKGIQLRGSGARVGPTLIYGVDYILAKRVRGIEPMRMAASEQPLTRERLVRAAVAFIRAELAKG